MCSPSLPHQHELRELQRGSPGGRALRDQRDDDYFRKIGKKGGDTTAARHGSEHFADMGRKSAEVRRWKKFKGPFTRRNWFPLLTVIERIVPHWPHQPARQRNRKKPLLIVTDSYLEEVAP